MIPEEELRLDDLQRSGMRILQWGKAFRFGTDSVLLADFARGSGKDRAADLGCGTGAIALLMLAREPRIRVDGIELQPEIAELARRNAALNHMEDRFHVFQGDLREFHQAVGYGAYSLAVCNPPYFREGAALRSENERIRLARHAGDLTPKELCLAAARLLRSGGRFATVYPAPRAYEMLRAMDDAGLAPKHIRTVHGIAGRPPKLILVDAVKGGGIGLNWLAPLELADRQGRPTDEMRRIYGEPPAGLSEQGIDRREQDPCKETSGVGDGTT